MVLIGPAILEKKTFEHCERRTDGRRPDAGPRVYHKLTNELINSDLSGQSNEKFLTSLSSDPRDNQELFENIKTLRIKIFYSANIIKEQLKLKSLFKVSQTVHVYVLSWCPVLTSPCLDIHA